MTNKKNNNRGVAILVAVLIFAAASGAVLGGFVAPIIREARVVTDRLQGENSYFTAEAGTEDAIYRLKNSLGAPSTVGAGGGTTTVTVTTVSGGKEILSIADYSGRVRKVRTKISTGQGVDFNYGVQAGQGGFIMGNSAGVYGNVYSNGNITGENSAFITGTALAANQADPDADQANIDPLPPTASIIFAKVSGSADAAQSFVLSGSGMVNEVWLYIKKTSTPGDVTVRIVGDSSNKPGINTLSSGILSASQVTGSYGWIRVAMSNYSFTAGATYWLVLDANNNSSKYYDWAANSNYPDGQALIGVQDGAWSDTNPAGLDGYFQIFIGGVLSSISGVAIGQAGAGDAWARTVTNSTIAGNLYCQIGSGNNKSCNTSRADPSPTNWPVSDANIAAWKTGAEAGGIISGNYTLNGSDAVTLGPKKIIGNLTLNNSSVLTMAGTVWVTGIIDLNNSARIRLDPSYGSASGILLSDGRIELGNSTQFSGSGQAGSYVLLLTNSECPSGAGCNGSSAIELSNSAGAVLLNAQRGTIHLGNSAGIKEATAKTMLMDNSATITYESGIADLHFNSGPSGGWTIDSWEEVTE